MGVSAPYDHDSFHSVSSLHVANDNFRSKNGPLFVEKKLKSLILEHQVAQLFGVSLVHRHFDLEAGTVLVEKDRVTLPWKCDTSFVKHGGDIIPSSWFCKEGELLPYEFAFYPYSTDKPPSLEEHSSFVRAFFDAVNSSGMSDCIGLRRLSGNQPADMLECTEGKANIMFSRGEVPDELFKTGTTDTMWFFDGQPPYRMYRCACRNTGSSTNPNHNHIDGL